MSVCEWQQSALQGWLSVHQLSRTLISTTLGWRLQSPHAPLNQKYCSKAASSPECCSMLHIQQRTTPQPSPRHVRASPAPSPQAPPLSQAPSPALGPARPLLPWTPRPARCPAAAGLPRCGAAVRSGTAWPERSRAGPGRAGPVRDPGVAEQEGGCSQRCSPSRRAVVIKPRPLCDVINGRRGRGEACARPGMVRGGPAPPWSRNDRRCRWRMPPSCPRAPCRTGTASGSATSTPRSPSERAGGCATEWRCGPGAALPPRGTAPRPPVEPRSAALPLPAPPPPPSTRSPSPPGLPSVLARRRALLSAPPEVQVHGCPRACSTFGPVAPGLGTAPFAHLGWGYDRGRVLFPEGEARVPFVVVFRRWVWGGQGGQALQRAPRISPLQITISSANVMLNPQNCGRACCPVFGWCAEKQQTHTEQRGFIFF